MKMFSLFQAIVLLIFTVLSYSIVVSSPVSAQEECSEQRLRNLGVIVVNCEGANRCIAPSADTPNSAPSAGSSIYVIGDSITYGMVTSGDLLNKLTTAGYAVSPDYSDTGGSGSPQYQVSGPSVIAEQGRSISWGNDQATNNASAIAASDTLLIGLGTNDLGSTGESITNNINTLIGTVRSQNPSIVIYWTNVYIAGSPTAQTTINQAIESIALADPNMNVIPWGTSQEAVDYVSSDGIHPSGNYPEMADYVVSQFSNSNVASEIQSSTGLAGCTCSQSNPIVTSGTTEENYQNIWNYLAGGTVGLSPEAVAGVMGNLEVESGGTMDPQVVQFSANFPGDRSPELPLAQIEGRFGYGLAQWTSAGRQRNLIAFAAETGRSTGSLDLQLDFLMRELVGSYEPVYVTLTTPGVTVAQASEDFLRRFETPRPFTRSGTEAERQAEIANRLERSIRIFSEYSGSTGSYSGASCAGTEDGDIAIDLNAEDTSQVACATGTTVVDASIRAYNRGEQFVIRTCEYGGYTVNSQLSGPLKGLVDQATAERIPLSANNSFRSMDEQIGVYNRWCGTAGRTPTPPPYPKPSRSDYTSCPGGAPPGYSNHQMGFAIDFNCSGALIPKSYSSAQSNQCFTWLQQNAGNYGLFELGRGENRERSGYEGWHWSVDGS